MASKWYYLSPRNQISHPWPELKHGMTHRVNDELLSGIYFKGIMETNWWEQVKHSAWWRHQMETFSALIDFSSENSPVTGEFTTQRPVTLSFDAFLSPPGPTIKQTMDTSVIWDAITFIMPSL